MPMRFWTGLMISAVSSPRVQPCGISAVSRCSVDSVILEALQCPIAGSLHLGRAGEPRADLRSEVFQVLHQFGVSRDLVGNLLIGLLHGFVVVVALRVGAL